MFSGSVAGKGNQLMWFEKGVVGAGTPKILLWQVLIDFSPETDNQWVNNRCSN
jgi:hypothetical protein